MKTLSLTLAFILPLALSVVSFVPASMAAPDLGETNNAVGTILEVEGLATVTRPGASPGTASVNMVIHPQDVIATGPRARVYIQLIDNTELTLGENGQLTIDDYAFDPRDDRVNHAQYSVLKGAFLYVSGLVAKKDKPDVTVNTPFASIGIRGTKFWGGIVDNEYGVIVGDGAVVVDTGGGTATLRRGQGTTLRAKGVAPGPVRIWDKAKINRAVETIALKDPAGIGQRMQQNIQRNEVLRERHRAIIQQRISKAVEEEKTTTTSASGTSDDARKRQRLLNAQRENTATATTSTAGKAVSGAAGTAAKATGKTLDAVTGTTSTVVDTAAGVVRATPLRETTTAVTDTATGTVKAVTETTKTVTETAGGAVGGTVTTTTETVKTTVEKTTDTVKDTTAKTTGTVKDVLKGTTGLLKKD